MSISDNIISITSDHKNLDNDLKVAPRWLEMCSSVRNKVPMYVVCPLNPRP